MTQTILSLGSVIDADTATVRRRALVARPGPVDENNAMLFDDHGPATLEGGPDTFKYRAADMSGTVEVTRSTIRYAGGWWFRGSYTIEEAGPGRTSVTFLVENIARSPRWTVWLANRGFGHLRTELTARFRVQVTRLAHAIGAPSPVFDPGAEVDAIQDGADPA